MKVPLTLYLTSYRLALLDESSLQNLSKAGSFFAGF